MRRVVALWLLLSLPGIAMAGHGLMNAFSGIAWLPDPGLAPDSLWYPVQRWTEQLRFAALSAPTARLRFSLGRARMHLATAEALAAHGRQGAMQVALGAWQENLDRAFAAVEGLPSSARLALLDEILEQQYIASTDYLDLPRTTRRPLRDALQWLGARYAILAAGLSRQDREARFAREEEVRWSMSMTAAADEQGL